MIALDEVLYGVQPKENRRKPQIPEALHTVTFSDVVIDSRLVAPDTLFVALGGERVDGHSFLADAVERGARGALVLREKVEGLQLKKPAVVVDPATGAGLEQAGPETVLLIAVDDPIGSLHRLASYHRELFTPIVIGITGSVGKTSTKEATAAVLSRRYRTLKNPRSYNSESTLPIVVLRIDDTHEVAVLEMGMYGPGDIALLAEIARPTIGIVTNVGPSHMERAGSIEVIAQTKAELLAALPPDGYAILNIDDHFVASMAQHTQAKPFFYGLNPEAHLWADQIESRGLEGISFQAHHAGETVVLNLPLIGRHSVHTALAATAAGLLLGLGWDAIVDGLRDETAQLRLLAVPGVNETTLIDDTYNASPASAFAALNLLSELPGRHIAVIGDMLELGTAEEESHRMLGARAAEVADIFVALGTRSRWAADEARSAGMAAEHIYEVTSSEEATSLLKQITLPGDYILVKGSRAMFMERIVAELQHRVD